MGADVAGGAARTQDHCLGCGLGDLRTSRFIAGAVCEVAIALGLDGLEVVGDELPMVGRTGGVTVTGEAFDVGAGLVVVGVVSGGV